MKKILAITILAIICQQSLGCIALPSFIEISDIQECVKSDYKYTVATNSTPQVALLFNEASSGQISGRIAIKKTSGILGLIISDRATGTIKNGLSIEWKGGDNYELKSDSKWSVTCFKVIEDATTITVKIPVCSAGFPRTSVNLEVSINTNLATKHDAQPLSNAITNAAC